MNEPEKSKKFLSIKESLWQGWTLFRRNLKDIIVLEVAVLVSVGLLGSLSARFIEPIVTFGSTLNYIINTLLQCFMSIASIHVGMRVVDEKKIGFSDLFAKMRLMLKYSVALLCYEMAVVLGLICFIIPGLIILVRLSLFGFFIVDKDVGPIESLRLSWDTVSGASFRVFSFQVAVILLNAVGIVCLIVGALFTLPATMLASILVYRSLYQQTFPDKSLDNELTSAA